MRVRDAIDDATWLGQLAGRERKPRDEADVVGSTIGQHVLAASVDQVIAVLHGQYRKYTTRGLDVGDRHFAQSRVPDDTVVQQLTDGAELFVSRHARVDAMKLPEIDLFDAELPETALGLRNQIGGASVWCPPVRSLARESCLRRDQHSSIRMKRLSDQFLRDIGAIA